MAEKRRISRGDGPGFFVAAAASAAAIFLALLIVMVLAFGLPVIKESLDGGEGSLLSWQWNAGRGQFGILPMVAGSLLAAACAAICAWPLALGLCAVNLAAGPRRGPGAWLKKALAALVRFMTAVPTVIYGFASVFLLLPFWRDFMKTGAGYGLGPTIMVLCLLILPTMVLVMEAGFKNIYARHSLAGAALGFGPFQTFVFWVLPLGRSALLSAFLLGFGRAIGDTLISLMLAGNAPQAPMGLSESFRTLTAHMALVTANEAGGQAYNSLFAAGTLVLLISCAISLSARFLNSPGRKKTWGQGGRVITRLGKVRGLSSSFPAETFKPPLNCGGALPLRGAAALKLRPAYLAWGPGAVRFLGWLAGAGAAAAIAAIISLLLYRGWGHLGTELFFGDTAPWAAITGQKPVWDGIWPACLGTLALVGLTVVLALPPGLGCGIYLSEFASPRARRYIGAAMDMAAGVPSIVMGLFGFNLIIFLRGFFPQANTCLFLAAFCLSLLVLPALTISTREALAALPNDLRLSLAALGFSRRQRLYKALLPAASRGILGGVILALGRAAEDAAVIMLTGAVANAGLWGGIFGKFQALPFTIYYTAAEYQSQAELDRGFGAALVLLSLSAALFCGARIIERGYSRRLKGSLKVD